MALELENYKYIQENLLDFSGNKLKLNRTELNEFYFFKEGAGIDKFNDFSTGEKQLICLARALAKNPKILILDESTANIDSETEQSVGKAITELKQGRTTLIIAHRLSTIKNADNIFVLNKGVVVESGNHEQLLQKNGVYKKMYETQIKG